MEKDKEITFLEECSYLVDSGNFNYYKEYSRVFVAQVILLNQVRIGIKRLGNTIRNTNDSSNASTSCARKTSSCLSSKTTPWSRSSSNKDSASLSDKERLLETPKSKGKLLLLPNLIIKDPHNLAAHLAEEARLRCESQFELNLLSSSFIYSIEHFAFLSASDKRANKILLAPWLSTLFISACEFDK